MNAYEIGREAFDLGLPLIDNPYEPLSGDWHDWQRGWCDAQNDEAGA